jgi:hypothetical protein
LTKKHTAAQTEKRVTPSLTRAFIQVTPSRFMHNTRSFIHHGARLGMTTSSASAACTPNEASDHRVSTTCACRQMCPRSLCARTPFERIFVHQRPTRQVTAVQPKGSANKRREAGSSATMTSHRRTRAIRFPSTSAYQCASMQAHAPAQRHEPPHDNVTAIRSLRRRQGTNRRALSTMPRTSRQYNKTPATERQSTLQVAHRLQPANATAACRRTADRHRRQRHMRGARL